MSSRSPVWTGNRVCGRRPDDVAQLVDRRADANRDEVHARHHHLSRGEIAELEQLAQDASRLAAQQAALLALLDDELQLLGRVIALFFGDAAPTPTARSTAFRMPLSATTSGSTGFCSASMSGDTHRAVRVAPCSASVFGTISPSTMCRYVSTAMAMTLATRVRGDPPG